jgi:hypothetical protein
LIALALSEVVAHACGLYEATGVDLRHWQALAEADEAPFYDLRVAPGVAPVLGADNRAWL